MKVKKSSSSNTLIPKLKRASSNDSLSGKTTPRSSLDTNLAPNKTPRKDLDEKFLAEAEKMTNLDDVIAAMKTNDISFRKCSFFDLKVVDTRTQLFRMNPLKLKLLIHCCQISKKNTEDRNKLVKLMSVEKEDKIVEAFLKDLMKHMEKRTDFEGDPVFSDDGEVILISKEMMLDLVFERYGFEQLDEWMIYGHYKVFSEDELMRLIEKKGSGDSYKPKIKKLIEFIKYCGINKEITKEEYLEEIKILLTQ